MADRLDPRSPFDALLVMGNHGRVGASGVIIRDRSARAIYAFHGGDLPSHSCCARLETGWLVTTAPDQGLWFADRSEATAPTISNSAVTDLSGSRAILSVEGLAWREVVSAFLPVDLDPRVFFEGGAAASVGGHMPLTLWRPAGLDGIELCTYRSYAGSFWHMVEHSARMVGFETVV